MTTQSFVDSLSQRSNRIHFVCINDDKEDPDSIVWWPGLVYASFKEMQMNLRCDRARMHAVLDRKKIIKYAPKYHWARLLGAKRPNNNLSIAPIKPDSVTSKIKDYMESIDEMEDEYMKYPGWKEAVESADKLLENMLEEIKTHDTTNIQGDLFRYFEYEKEDKEMIANESKFEGGMEKQQQPLKKQEISTKNAETDLFPLQDDKINGNFGIKSSQMNDGDRNVKRKQGNEDNSTRNKDALVRAKKVKVDNEQISSSSKLSTRQSPRSKASSQDLINISDSRISSEPKSPSTNIAVPDEVPSNNKTRRSSPRLSEPKSPSTNIAVPDEVPSNNKTRRSSPRISEPKIPSTNIAVPDKVQTRRSSPRLSVPADASPSSGRTRRLRLNEFISPSANIGTSDEVPSNQNIRISSPRFELLSSDKAPDEKKLRSLARRRTDLPKSQNKSKRIQQTSKTSGSSMSSPRSSSDISSKSSRQSPRLHAGKKTSPSRQILSSLKHVTPNKNDAVNKNQSAMIARYKKGGKKIIEKNEKWTEVMNILGLSHGYYRVIGSHLVSEYWVNGKCEKGLNEKEIRKKLIEGQDYYLAEDGLKAHVHKKYGWVGPKGLEYQPVSGKRRRERRDDATEKKRTDKASQMKKTKRVRVEQKPSKQEISDKLKKTPKKSMEQGVPKTKSKTRNKSLTLKQRLNGCLDRLKVSNLSEDNLYCGSEISPKFASKHDSIMLFLEASVNEENNKSSLMYVCGNPGMGKTTIVNYCVGKMIKQSTQCRSLFLNLGASSADLSIDDISKALLGRSDVIGEVKKTLKRTSKKHKVHLIVVLDELDFLLTSTSKMKNSVLGEILSWASDPLYRLSIIGISNSVGDEIARRLHKNAKIGTELVFEPYGHEDLVGIINQRLGPDKTLAEDKAVIYAAKKVAAINGDARRILDLVSDALKQSKSFQSKEMLSSKNVDRPVLKMVHVMMAVKNDKGIVSYVDRINCLPPKAKAVLCVASAIHRQRKTWKNIKLSKLRDICMEVTNRGLIDEEMNTERFRELVETLEDAGLFASGGVDEFTSRDDGCDNFSGRTIRVGASLDDVEVALNQSLLKCSDGEMDPNAKFKDIIDKFCERNYAEKL